MTSQLNPFEIAQHQLDDAAAILWLTPAMHAFLRVPMRELHFTIPVQMDDGSFQTFQVSGSNTMTLADQPKAAFAFTPTRPLTRCGPWAPG